MQRGERELTLTELEIREVGRSAHDTIFKLNQVIFDEDRVINSFNRQGLLQLLALHRGRPVGFKIGYEQRPGVFYSAKGGVLPDHRRMGIATALLDEMIAIVRKDGYQKFVFDTFPNMHPGMTMLALAREFRLTKADFNHTYQDYRLQFTRELKEK